MEGKQERIDEVYPSQRGTLTTPHQQSAREGSALLLFTLMLLCKRVTCLTFVEPVSAQFSKEKKKFCQKKVVNLD